MKKLISAVVFAVSTAVFASSAMAAPDYHHRAPSHSQAYKHHVVHKPYHKIDHKKHYRVDHKKYHHVVHKPHHVEHRAVYR